MLSAQELTYEHQQDIVYGHKDGLGLIMDVFKPKEDVNKAGVIWVVSGGMNSSPQQVRRPDLPNRLLALLDNGYTVFAVMHGSQPRFAILEICDDMRQSVRFIRTNANRFGVDGDRLGSIGFSSGGQLSLYLATTGKDAASRLQASIAYFPGTDMANFGKPATTITEHFRSVGHRALGPFDFKQWNESLGKFESVMDVEERKRIFVEFSPITHVSADDPPVLLFHGDRDRLVPIQQSRSFLSKMKGAGATCELHVAEGKNHGWGRPMDGEIDKMIGWFDRHLLEHAR